MSCPVSRADQGGVQELGAPEEAHTAFSSAIMLCSALPQAWLSWGAFCDGRARTDGPQWTQHAVSAYLQVPHWPVVCSVLCT